MSIENPSQEFRLKNETRNYFFEETLQNEFMSKKHEKVCTTLNYRGHFLILASAVTGCILIFAFASWYFYKNKKCKTIIKKKNRKHDKIILLPNTMLNSLVNFKY